MSFVGCIKREQCFELNIAIFVAVFWKTWSFHLLSSYFTVALTSIQLWENVKTFNILFSQMLASTVLVGSRAHTTIKLNNAGIVSNSWLYILWDLQLLTTSSSQVRSWFPLLFFDFCGFEHFRASSLWTEVGLAACIPVRFRIGFDSRFYRSQKQLNN